MKNLFLIRFCLIMAFLISIYSFTDTICHSLKKTEYPDNEKEFLLSKNIFNIGFSNNYSYPNNNCLNNEMIFTHTNDFLYIKDIIAEKINNQRASENFNIKFIELTKKIKLKKETGYLERLNGMYKYINNASTTNESNELTLPNLDIPLNKNIIGILHTHVNDYSYSKPDIPGVYHRSGIKIFSPSDVVYFMRMVNNAKEQERPLTDVYMTLISGKGNYQLRFTGNQYQVKTFNRNQLSKFKDFREDMQYKKDDQQKLEDGFLEYVSRKMNIRGVTLYRLNKDGSNTKLN